MIQASNGKGCEPNELQQTIDDIINNGYSGKISIRVPKTLHKQLIEFAQAENISLNQYILYKLSK